MNNRRYMTLAGVLFLAAALVPWGESHASADRWGRDPGGPIDGLTPELRELFERGRDLFTRNITAEEGLGPIYNEAACQTCHGGDGAIPGGPDGNGVGSEFNVTHFGFDWDGQFNAMRFAGGPLIQRRSIRDTTHPECPIEGETLPPGADIVSIRHTPAVWGFGLIDAIEDETILENEALDRDGVHGFANWGREMQGRAASGTIIDPQYTIYGSARVGRFGWKAQTGTIRQFSADPFDIEAGVTSPFFPQEFTPTGLRLGEDLPPDCQIADHPVNDVDDAMSRSLYHFQALVAPATPLRPNGLSRRGERVFDRIGCDTCHVERMRTGNRYYLDVDGERAVRVRALENEWVEAYSDFLVHDMGDELADNGGANIGRIMGRAAGRHWRTTPLWGLRFKNAYLHDGRTASLDEAIRAHGGEAQNARDRYADLNGRQRAALLYWLSRL